MHRAHIISAVDHVIEPPAVWNERMSKSKFGARIPTWNAAPTAATAGSSTDAHLRLLRQPISAR